MLFRRRRRLRRIQARFLEASRSLEEGRRLLARTSGPLRWLLRTVSPVPLLALDEEGGRILAALQWLESQCRSVPVSEAVIRRYHGQVFGSHADAGEYRRVPATMIRSSVATAPPKKISAMMKHLDGSLAVRQREMDLQSPVDEDRVLEVAMDLHQRIGMIHPFADGNGRVARLASNHLLRRYGAPYVILPPLSDESPLLEALQSAHRGNLAPLVAFARTCRHPM